ncbi:hypothetical protein A2335_00635 [Candidatus Peregrinibacteria bacterium RIFOXYB2_FULL_32_7]|nr:MAG: hypothetical protein A2335_00635 [Candidatus Peregrinibacteria bacterium RIFOXYB2_FULL_32_7]
MGLSVYDSFKQLERDANLPERLKTGSSSCNIDQLLPIIEELKKAKDNRRNAPRENEKETTLHPSAITVVSSTIRNLVNPVTTASDTQTTLKDVTNAINNIYVKYLSINREQLDETTRNLTILLQNQNNRNLIFSLLSGHINLDVIKDIINTFYHLHKGDPNRLLRLQYILRKCSAMYCLTALLKIHLKYSINDLDECEIIANSITEIANGINDLLESGTDKVVAEFERKIKEEEPITFLEEPKLQH